MVTHESEFKKKQIVGSGGMQVYLTKKCEV